MVNAISAIGALNAYVRHIDPEYMRIIQEMLALGLTPTGDKEADRATLEAEKKRLAEKALKAREANIQNNSDNKEKSEMEIQKAGAMNLAELNKILLGLNLS